MHLKPSFFKALHSISLSNHLHELFHFSGCKGLHIGGSSSPPFLLLLPVGSFLCCPLFFFFFFFMADFLSYQLLFFFSSVSLFGLTSFPSLNRLQGPFVL